MALHRAWACGVLRDDWRLFAGLLLGIPSAQGAGIEELSFLTEIGARA